MKYVITNYICIGGTWFDSEPMEYEQAEYECSLINIQARRGLRPFPDLIEC